MARGSKPSRKKLFEQYQHAGKRRYQYDPHLDPQLVWTGEAEHTSFALG